MENFIVSARKYRPQTFDTVVGQHSITNTLKNAIRSNHLAQAFLFCGPRGVGKTTCARILAKTINCKNLSENIEACNECESCISFNKSASFNIHELDAASNNSVEDIRNLVDQVRIPPQVGKYKVYIIDEVHMLSQAAFNAFLKTLEEPPAYAKFILATTEKHKIIPTILSRCQIYDFKRITVEDIAGHLAYVAEKENVTAEQDALHIIAQKSDGALRDALSIFDQIVSFGGKNITYKNVIENLNVLDYDYYFKIVDALLSGSIKDTLLLINEIIDNGFDGQHFIIGFGGHLRNLLVCKDPGTLELLEVGKNIKAKYQQQSDHCAVEFLLNALFVNNKCDIDYKSSNNKKLHLELALIQMSSINKAPAIASASVTKTPPEKKSPLYPLPSDKEKIQKVEEAKKETTVPPPRLKPSATGTISIKDSNSNQKKKDLEASTEENNNNLPAEEFSQEKLETEWNKMASGYEQDKNFYTTLTKNKPKKDKGNGIIFEVDNKIQKKAIEDQRMDILPALREKLNNSHINLKVNVTGPASMSKPYTSHEKFNKMAEKNPDLRRLKDQLGLEIDF